MKPSRKYDKTPASDLDKLGAPFVNGLGDEGCTVLMAKLDHYLKSIPLIRVDNLLRNTAAKDMPEGCRSALMILAGFANAEDSACYPSRPTLAARAGMIDLARWDVTVTDLINHGWVSSHARFKLGDVACTAISYRDEQGVRRYRQPDGEAVPVGAHQESNLYLVHPETGSWWGEEGPKRLRPDRGRGKRCLAGATRIVPPGGLGTGRVPGT